MKNIPDLSRLARRFQKGNAGIKEIIRFYQLSIKLPRLKDELTAVCESGNQELADIIQTQYLSVLDSCVEDLSRFQELVESTVDLQAADNHEYIIKAEFDDNLRGLFTITTSHDKSS